MHEGHGNNIHDYANGIRGDFSSNIPYQNASTTIADYLKNRLAIIQNYPDPLARRLTGQIAAHHGLSPDNVLVTNGSAEAFYLVAHLFRSKQSTIPYPSFAEYEDACRTYNHTLTFLPTATLHQQHRFESDAAWFAVPNNPDGTLIGSDTIHYFCHENRQTTFIVDTAYSELCPQCESLIPLHAHNPNLITVHSLTKTFGIPGLRLGYIVAPPSVITRLRQLCPPWTVNALAQEAGSYIMDNYRVLQPDSKILCNEAASFRTRLRALAHLTVYDSPCHFFLVRLEKGTAKELKRFLLSRRGLLIRDASNFRGLSPHHVRLSVQDQHLNDELVKGMDDFFKETE